MKSLYVRIWLTVVVALAAFALVSGALVQRTLAQEREQARAAQAERTSAWGELIARSLPGADEPPAAQELALEDWSRRMRMPMALDGAGGERIAATEAFRRAEAQGDERLRRAMPIALDDGRVLHVLRGPPMRAGAGGPPFGPFARGDWMPFFGGPPGPPPGGLPPGVGLAVLLLVLFLAVAAGAYPVVRRLTRRLEALKHGVEAFGHGALGQRVDDRGHDEVAAVAASFNRAAQRIESLVQANRRLLADASHELRSPLARLKMAVEMFGDAPAPRRDALRHEIDTNIAELDALVEEVLLASRLEAGPAIERREPVDAARLAAEEAGRAGAAFVPPTAPMPPVAGDERLLRRALRNLLENARRYGGDGEVEVSLRVADGGGVEWEVADRGPGVPEAERERIFEPFYRLPGHAERAGGVGLGLSLVRQIARGHGGEVACRARDGGGSVFVLRVAAG